jgi:hypothetical protein
VHLPPNIKKTTPVFVTFRLGQDGILCKAIVDVLDKKFEKDLGRGYEWTDKIERGLIESEKKLREKVSEGIVAEGVANNMREKIENVTRISMEGREKDAVAELEKLKAEIENLKKKSIDDELIQRAESICIWTDAAVNLYSHLIDPNEHVKISHKVEELRNVIKTGNKDKIKSLMDDLDKTITFDNHPDIFVLMSCRGLELKLKDKDPVTANKIRTKRVDFEEAFSKGDQNLAVIKFKELVNEMNSARIEGPEGWKNDHGGVEKKYETHH